MFRTEELSKTCSVLFQK